MESQSASITTNMDIWQRSTDQRKRNKTSNNALNVIKKGIQPEIAKKHR